jgi:anion-transporting  ArsA/GET3 family ATPase
VTVVPDLLDRRFIFVTGKGGVGKTTVAGALGLAVAARGRRTVVCEVGEQQRLTDVFGVRAPRGGREVELAPGLAGTSIEPNAVLRHWLEVQLRSRTLVAVLARTPVFVYFIAAVPGAREVITLAQAWNLAQPQRWGARQRGYDTVILDAPASGHAIGMLRTPRTFAEMARVGTVRRQADRVRSLITDPDQTAYVAVALPEEMPITETLELESRLRAEVGLGPEAVIVNGMLSQRFSASDLGRLARERVNGRGPATAAALDAARVHGERARTQAGQLRRLRRGTEAPVVTLPALLDGDLGRAELERLARELERKLGAARADRTGEHGDAPSGAEGRRKTPSRERAPGGDPPAAPSRAVLD